MVELDDEIQAYAEMGVSTDVDEGPTFDAELGDFEGSTFEPFKKQLPEFSVGEIIDPEEAEFAKNHPNIYATGKALQATIKKVSKVVNYFPHTVTKEGARAKQEAGRFVANMTPLVRHGLTPEGRERFYRLDQTHQTRALLWDTMEILSFFPGGQFVWPALPFMHHKMFSKEHPKFGKLDAALTIATAIPGGKALKKILEPSVSGMLAKRRFVPVEDLAMREYGARPFVSDVAVSNKLKKIGISNEHEVVAIINEELPTFIPHKISVEKGTLSQGLKDAIEWIDHKPRLKPEVQNMIDPKALRAEHYQAQWHKYGKQVFGNDWTPQLEHKVFDAHLERVSPGTIVKLEEATPELMKAIHRDMFLKPKVANKMAADVAGVYDTAWADIFSPVRVVYGTWEHLHKGYSKVYKVIKRGNGDANIYDMEKRLSWAKALEQYGLGKARISKSHNVRFDPGASKKQFDNAFNAMRQLDNIAEQGSRNPVFKANSMQRAKDSIMHGLDNTEKRIVQATRDWLDSMHGDYMLEKIPQLFEQYNLTGLGQLGVEQLMTKIAPKIGTAMSSNSGLTYTQKYAAIEGILEEARKTLDHPWVTSMERHPWFNAEGRELKKIFTRLANDLTMSGTKSGGKFVGYLEDYVARIGTRQRSLREGWDNFLVPAGKDDPVGRMEGFFTKSRTQALSYDPVIDFDSMIRARIRAQARDLFLYPRIQKAIEHLQSVDAPRKLRSYTDHWISRILGRPSHWDVNLANLVKRLGVENLPRILGGGPWDDRRVMDVAQKINNANIMAGLGFKPFSLIRNMFQPLLTVPADLGGIKSIGHLARGIKRQLDPEFRQYIRDIGGIGEFVPEIARTQHVLPFGVGAKMERVSDTSLWLYKMSDRWNRYVTGGAAAAKWDDAVKAIGGEERLATMPNYVMKKFMKKAGFSGRYPVVRNEIMELLSKGNVSEAKATFVRDVIADTQFLYDIAESPVAPSIAGSVSKTGFLFQSWWMNYGTLLEKWLRTGDSGKSKANRMFTFMLCSAAAEQMMEPLFGQATAQRSTFMGVFPTEVNEFLVPAAWAPIYHLIKFTGTMPFTSTDESEKMLKAFAKSFYMFAPGGLQLKTFADAASKEGFEGLAPAIFRFHQDKDYKPLWGALD
jgi:hypothetical protein